MAMQKRMAMRGVSFANPFSAYIVWSVDQRLNVPHRSVRCIDDHVSPFLYLNVTSQAATSFGAAPAEQMTRGCSRLAKSFASSTLADASTLSVRLAPVCLKDRWSVGATSGAAEEHPPLAKYTVPRFVSSKWSFRLPANSPSRPAPVKRFQSTTVWKRRYSPVGTTARHGNVVRMTNAHAVLAAAQRHQACMSVAARVFRASNDALNRRRAAAARAAVSRTNTCAFFTASDWRRRRARDAASNFVAANAVFVRCSTSAENASPAERAAAAASTSSLPPKPSVLAASAASKAVLPATTSGALSRLPGAKRIRVQSASRLTLRSWSSDNADVVAVDSKRASSARTAASAASAASTRSVASDDIASFAALSASSASETALATD